MSKQESCRPTPLAAAPDRARIAAAAGQLKALGDPVRLELLTMITTAEAGEVCVCDLTVAFDLKAPTISHHLKVLRTAGLVEAERRGTWIYYRARPEALEAITGFLQQLRPVVVQQPVGA